MTLEELQQDEWYLSRPKSIRDAIDLVPPIHLYKFKTSGKCCHIISYEEPKEGDKVTITVQKTGEGGALAELGLGVLDTNRVFGVALTDIEQI